MTRLIAIGDIHGCVKALDAVINAISLAPDDRLVFLGDYVDRGPDTREVIERLMELEDRATVIRLIGNHEEMMLSAIRGEAPIGWWMRYGGVETLESYGFSGDLACIPERHLQYLEACVDWHEEGEYFFVHANYLADEPLNLQPREITRWSNLAQLAPGPHRSGKRAVVGHSSQKSGEILDLGYLRCIDTFCHGGGWLTALEVNSGTVWQASRDGKLREPCPRK